MTNEEAIEILQREDSVCIETDEALEAYGLAIEALRNEPKKGKWLEGDFYCDTYEGFESWGNFKVCSECGEESKKTTNYCSNCGAKMKEAK